MKWIRKLIIQYKMISIRKEIIEAMAMVDRYLAFKELQNYNEYWHEMRQVNRWPLDFTAWQEQQEYIKN